MLQQRIITALCLVTSLLLLLFFASKTVFIAALTVVLGLSAYEWANLSGIKTQVLKIIAAAAVSLLFLIALNLLGIIHIQALYGSSFASHLAQSNSEGSLLIQCFHAHAVLISIISLWVFSYPASQIIWKAKWLRFLIGFGVLIPFFIALASIRELGTEGVHSILYVIALVAMVDIGGYFVGRKFGRTKLHAKVSPGKTWEGFLGGVIVGAVFATLLYASGFTLGLNFIPFLSVALITMVVGVMGDLFESMLKRYRGIKDSSNILPGHGGILDRIDSHIAALPVFYLLYLVLSTH